MTIQAQLADGRVLEFPDGTDPKVIQATVKRVIANPLAAKSTEALESAESAPMSFGDTFKTMGSGVFGAGKSFVDFFGTGTDLAKGLAEKQQYLDQIKTPERQAEIARRSELEDRAARSGSMLQEAKAYLGGIAEAPIQSLAGAVGSSVPAIAVSILALPAEAPAALALGVGTIAKLAVGAIQGEGERKGSVFDAVKAEYMKQGKSEKEAEALAIKSSEFSRETAFQTGGAMLLGALDAATGAEPGVAKALRKAAPTGVLTKEAIEKGVAALPDKAISAPSYLGQFVKGVAAEAPLEGSQGAFGQYSQNVALQQAGADVTPMQGVLGAGLRDAAVGALFGGTASPLGMKSARQEYATDQFLRQAKEDIELDKRAADTAREKREQIQKTQSQLGVPVTGENVSNVLMLPAPGKKYEEPKDLLNDPVGRITEDELGKAIGDNSVVNYLNKYRRDNNLPKLKSYSVEDIKDAMTAQNPEGEEGALNSILAYKTGYKDETYTVEDINNVAVAKNVATETKGFSDFLTRATGKSDLNTMTQPQLHSVYQALNALPREGKEQQLVLPEGSNATRFTQDQYNQGVTTALMGVKQGKPVTLEQARNAVKAQTDLKTDRDADQVLKTAASNEDLIIERGTGFQATNKTGEVLGTYGTEAEAKRNHRRADIAPVETQIVRAPEEVKTDKVAQLPEGYGIEKTAEVGASGPAAYVVRVDGSQKNESQTFAEEVDAKERLNALARGREANAKAKEAAADRIRQDLEKEQAKIVQMEADGLTGTSEHTKAVNTFKAANVTKSAQITSFLDEAEAFRAPLKIVPLGKKTAKVEKHTIIKAGKKLGTFPNRTEAEKSILTQSTDEELQTIADRGGAFGKRAEVELGERKRTTPGIKVKGTKEGLEAAGVRTQEVEAQLAELKAKLLPMLKKFGLEQVGLNVVRAIENDADGAWGKADKLIRIALQAIKPIQTMRHEALHALKELGFFTPQQWEALKRQAEKTWVNTYLKGQMVEVNGKKMTRYDAYANGVKNDDGSWALKPLSPEDIIEEAIADAFGSWEGGQKPPPGLMAALFKRMQQFFTALREALTGAGFESAEDIFGKIERGELKAAAVPTPSKIDSKMSLRQANYNKDPDRLEVSTARPTALRPMPGEIAPRDPIKDFYVIDSEDIMSVPAHMASAHNAISTYNWFPVSEDPNATIRAMKDTIVDNLVWLYNLTPENIRNRAKLWYNGANRIAKDWSKVYGYSLRQMAGVLAVLSPQKDWFMNTSLGERVVHVYTQRQNDKWSPDMTAWADSYVKAARDIETRDKRQVVFDAAKRLEGAKLKDMNIEDMAYFVRVFDETYHSRKYRVITPEGMFGDYVTVNEEVGEDEDASGGQGDVAWGTYDSIKKAISILQDGSQENISEQLGDEHKVRNFNNNIVDPDSASGSVTIDTHAVGAASFKALSGASLEVLHNFGTTPKGLVSAGGSAMTGASGTYGFIADAYREAAAMVGVLPREMQSITWEAIRSIFPAAWKSQNASSVNAIYDGFKAGEITLKEARDEVLKISGGIKKFAWENDKSGAFPSTGATSFDVNKQDARVLQPYQIKEKLKINLSAAPSMEKGAEVIPGIKYLFDQTKQEDMAAYTLLQEVATDNIRHLLSGIENVKVATVPASGLFDESFEPSVNLAVTFNYGEKGEVLPALKRFAGNFKQKQIHVRQVSKLDVETEYEDGSYNTPVFTFKLEESFNRTEIKSIVRESGLPGITFTDNQVVAYFMRGKKTDTAEEFYGQIEKLAEQLGGFVSAIDRTVERLWVYGSGYGATQGYSAIKGNVRPGTGVTVQTAKRVASYVNNVRDGSIKTFENADITDEQANKQNVIGDMYDKLPIDDMDRPIVRKAYEALAPALLEQYRALPITVTWSKKKNKKGQPVDAYGSDSAAMRKDILNNNRLQILPTTPDSFGPEGYDFSGHPLLQETGLMLDGRPLLYNDLLRAVHDYYAHGMTEVGFGPKGEEAGWKNHMSMTKDPLARWALTMETRAQNSYVNFRSGLDRSKVPLNKRGFAMQKAALLPVQVALTGSSAVDKPMREFIKTLTKDEKLGSAGDIKLVPGEKYSLRTAPDTKEFKQWFGDSKVVDADGNPQVMYHGTRKDFSEFKPGLIFSSPNPMVANKFAANDMLYSPDKPGIEPGASVMPVYIKSKNPFDYENPDHVNELFEKIKGNFASVSRPAAKRLLSEGQFKIIEENVDAIKDMGFDGLYVEEFGEKNLAVFEPTQVKSATGNRGTFDETNKDIRYSLKTYFPTAEEAESAAYKKAPPTTAEFKRFFGGSTVKEEGRPQVMYHASMEDFSIFRENRPIFVSPDAGFAEDFIKRRIRESGSLNYLSEGQVKKKTAKIYPLWVRAETPFDFDNEEHVQQIVGYLQANNQVTGGRVQMAGLALKTPEEIAKGLSQGGWTFIEDGKTQEALKALGFDSFYTSEGGAKNLAVFKANQVKSITGNLGSFDESGDIRYSLRSAPTTPEFKRWFSSSKVVNEDGSPKVMYHGTNKDFNKFVIAEKANRTGMPDGFYFTSDQEDASRYAKGEGANVLPVYLSIKNPFNLGGKNKISKEMVMQFRDELRADNPNLPFSWIQEKVNIFKENTTAGRFPFPSINFPTAAMQRVFEVGGYDGLIDGGRVFVAFNSSQVKSATGNTGAFDRANPDIRYSLKPVSADIDAAIDRTTTAREDKGFIGRILEAIFPQSAGHFRQQALNRYNQLGVYDRMLADKMGGAAMLADQSAESAALMSDLSASVTASAFGYGNRTGGVPVYKNGMTTIDTSVKGPIAILAQLAKYNNPRIYQRYQFWAGVKRGKRFMADGKEKNFEQADIARAAQLEKEHPEFVQIQKEMNEFNNGLVKYMVQTGVIKPELAKVYMEHADYIPFYRQMDGEKTVGPNIFQSISGVKPPKALKGGEAPLADYLETIVRNTQSAIQSGMKNVAAQRAVNVAMQLGPKAGAQRLNTQESGFDIVQVLEKGERVSYRVADTLFIDACRSLNLPDLPFMGFLAAPANVLRNLVTKDPGFMLANLMRDSLSSWVTSGTSVKPIIGTVAGFAKALSGKSASMEALLNAGILGGYEFSSGVLKSGEVLEADLNKKYGKATGAKVLLKPFTSLWDALEKGTEASDAATRIAIYERVLADTGNEAEAIFRSLEVMNFNRKGSSAVIRIATAAIPFLNARMQGLDIFYRASFGRDTVADPAAKQRAFFVRGATLMALSIAMYTMVSDDDEYKKQEEETKDNYWIIPGVGKFPTPFEVGFLFKTVPERIYAYMFKDDTGEDLKESMKRGIISTLAFNPIPQTAKPLIEAAWNYNSFTGRAIVGAGMEGRSAEFQVGPSTSEVAEKLGGALGLSPLKIDHVLQGYTGTIGMYLVQLMDSVLSANDNSPRAAKRFEQLPIIKRFAVDPEARGNITQFYALKNATEQAVTTANFLERAGDPEVFVKYLEENAGLLANKDYVQSIEKEMKTLREARSMIQSADMGAEEKRDLLIDIGRVENALTENTKEVKKIFKEQ